MINWITTAIAAIGFMYVAVSSPVHAISTRADASRSEAFGAEEQALFPLCSLPLKRLLPVNPDGPVLIRICT